VETLSRHLLFKGPTSFLELVQVYARYEEDENETRPSEAKMVQQHDNGPPQDNTITFTELTGTTHHVASQNLYNTPATRFTIGEIRVAMLLLVRHGLVHWVEHDQQHHDNPTEDHKKDTSSKNDNSPKNKLNQDNGGANDLDGSQDLTLRIYFLEVERVFTLLLFSPRFVALCVDRWGRDQALTVCQQFIVHGKLTYFELIDKMHEHRLRLHDDEDNASSDQFAWKDQVSRIFDDMITARLLKRSENVHAATERVHTEIRETQEREEREEAELLSRKKGKKAKTIEQQLGIDDDFSLAGSTKGTKRKKRKGASAESHAANDLRSTVAALGKKRKRASTTRATTPSSANSPDRKKRKSSSPDPLNIGDDMDLMPEADDVVSSILQGKHPKEHIRNILWELNFDQFIRDLRKKRIVDYVANKYDENASVIVESILEMTIAYQRTKNDPQTKPVQFDSLAGHIQRNHAHRVTISSRVLDRLLENMVKLSLVERVSSQDRGSFRVNMGHIISTIKEQYLESIIHQKLGGNATRIFRMLLAKKYMEQKFVADEAMIQANEARKQLYLLMQHGYVSMEEVPKGADRTNPLRTIFLWHVDQEKVFQKTTEEMYRTIFNLRTRLASEQARMWEKVGIGNNTSVLKSYVFSDDQNRMLDDLKKMEDLLESSISRLSNMIMLFEDF